MPRRTSHDVRSSLDGVPPGFGRDNMPPPEQVNHMFEQMLVSLFSFSPYNI